MNLDEAETRLGLERSYLIHVQHSGRTSVIALAQANVARWEAITFRMRLESEGGWKP